MFLDATQSKNLITLWSCNTTLLWNFHISAYCNNSVSTAYSWFGSTYTTLCISVTSFFPPRAPARVTPLPSGAPPYPVVPGTSGKGSVVVMNFNDQVTQVDRPRAARQERKYGWPRRVRRGDRLHPGQRTVAEAVVKVRLYPSPGESKRENSRPYSCM